MFRTTAATTLLVLLWSSTAQPALAGDDVFAQSERPIDVAFHLVGQVQASPPAQYGFLSYVHGLPTVFSAAPENEATAMFTFYNDTPTVRVINNGPLRTIERVGTTTIYFNPTPSGNWATPETFRRGTAVTVSSLTHQVVLDTTTNKFTTTFVNKVLAVTPFEIDGHQYQLGRLGRRFRTQVFGQANNASSPAAFVIAGNGVGLQLVAK